MPYCTSCGNEVAIADKFCGRCGLPQKPIPGAFAAGAPGGAGPAPTPTPADLLGNMSTRTATLLCYVPWMGWLAAIVVLASPRFAQDRKVRFHAFQGLYLFVAWLLVEMVVSPILHIGHGDGPFRAASGLLHLAVLAAWVLMLIKTSQGHHYSLPIIGELAERSVAEQRNP